MSTARSRAVPDAVPAPPRDVALVDWPLRDAAPRCVAVLAAIALVATLVGWCSHSVPMGGLVQLVFVLALWRLWVPVTYRLGRDGVVEGVWRRWRHLDWPAITRAQIQSGGVLLVADRTNAPLAAIHGIFIPWKGRQEEVLDVIEYFISSRIEGRD